MKTILEVLDQAQDTTKMWFDVAEEYCEPGYNNPSGLIVVSNWNNDKPCIRAGDIEEDCDDMEALLTVGEALEKLGCDLIWEDEWVVTCCCNKFVRTKPDSYSWQQSFYDGSGEVVCHECIKKDKSLRDDYVDGLIGVDTNCLTIDIDLEEYGFVRIEQDFENGFYGGQAAHPKVIADWLRGAGVDRFVFVLDSVGQFDMDFSVWVDKEQAEANNITEIGNYNQKEDPAILLQRGLKNATKALNSLTGDGVKVATINGDQAVAKLVSAQDFIDGKALN